MPRLLIPHPHSLRIKRNIQQHVINTGSRCFCAQVTRLVLRLEDTFILYQKKNNINKSVATADKHTQRQKCGPDSQAHALKTGILTFPAVKSVLKSLCRVEVRNPCPTDQTNKYPSFKCDRV